MASGEGAPPPERIAGRYRLQSRLGTGQHTPTYRAWDEQAGTLVVIKKPAPAVDTTQGCAQILAEIHALKGIAHPGIAALLDHGDDKAGAWLAREFIAGQDLWQTARKQALNLESFRLLATQSLDILHAAHTAGILHGDVKPANLIIATSSNSPSCLNRFDVKLIDFSLATTLISHASKTISGTVHTLAPELCDNAPPSIASDLYATGCTFHFALTGHYPFLGDTSRDVLVSHALGRREPLPEGIPKKLSAWLDKLMARDPCERFSTAAAARDAYPL